MIKLLASLAGPWLLSIVNFGVQLAQTTTPGAGSSSVIVSGFAATAASGALAYMARQLTAGNLVHRSSADAEKRMDEVTEALIRLVTEGQKREEVYTRFLLGRVETGRGE